MTVIKNLGRHTLLQVFWSLQDLEQDWTGRIQTGTHSVPAGHPVFHVSQLKKALPSSHKVPDIIPVPNDCWQFPEQVLAKKMVSRGTSSTRQVLIKWSGWPEALATWEDLEALHQRFPGAPAWGQARSLGGRMSVPLLPSTLQGELGLGDHLSPTFLVFVFLAQSGTGPINCVACVSLRAQER
jgi:hypothetical protein